MPDKLTDAEVKKALECCKYSIYEKHCTECLLIDDVRCIELVTKSALDLINRQEAENEKNENIIRIADKTITTLKAEIERLKNHIKEGIDLAKQIPEMLLLTKYKAYKECIEKVKEKSCKLNMCHNDIVVKTDYQISGEKLDNLLNELVSDGDAHE